MQNAMWAMYNVYVYTQTLIGVFFEYGNGNMHCFTLMDAIFKRSYSKLKGQFTAVKSGSGISEGPSINLHSLS